MLQNHLHERLADVSRRSLLRHPAFIFRFSSSADSITQNEVPLQKNAGYTPRFLFVIISRFSLRHTQCSLEARLARLQHLWSYSNLWYASRTPQDLASTFTNITSVSHHVLMFSCLAELALLILGSFLDFIFGFYHEVKFLFHQAIRTYHGKPTCKPSGVSARLSYLIANQVSLLPISNVGPPARASMWARFFNIFLDFFILMVYYVGLMLVLLLLMVMLSGLHATPTQRLKLREALECLSLGCTGYHGYEPSKRNVSTW